jgi:hypothetical protein
MIRQGLRCRRIRYLEGPRCQSSVDAFTFPSGCERQAASALVIVGPIHAASKEGCVPYAPTRAPPLRFLIFLSALVFRRLLASAREEDQIAIWIAHDECPRAPRLGLESLMEFDSRSLKLKKKRLRVIEGDGSGE